MEKVFGPTSALFSSLYTKLPFHLLDQVMGLPYVLKIPRFQIFPYGWGASYTELKKIFHSDLHIKVHSAKINWYSKQKGKTFSTWEGSFWVPASEALPEEIRHAHLRFIVPPDNHNKVCLILAGWGEHGYNLRMRLANALWQRGIGSILLESPFHGHRMVPGRLGTSVFTVAEMGQLARAAIAESRTLLTHFKRHGYEVGVAGFSMGGSFAGIIASTMPFPLPTTLLSAPISPEIPFFDGLLSKGVCWQAFRKIKNPKEKLRKLFRAASLRNFAPPKSGSKMILMGARSDLIVKAQSIEEIHHHWPDSEIRWRPGGHLSLWLLDITAMAQAIEDTFA